jgi:hypothetical protein
MDSNINLLNLNHNTNTQLFLETIYSNGFSQIIGKATRIQGNSFSLIDHICTKVMNKVTTSGVILTDFSDHFMTFVQINNCVYSNNKEFILTRDFSNAKIDNFRDNLRNIRWNNVVSFQDANVCYNNFWNDFSLLYNLHFPVKKVTFNRNVHRVNPYMTIGLLISRRRKIELHKKALRNHEHTMYYRSYRNIYNAVLKQSKKLYIEENFKNYKGNPKKTWDFLKRTTFGEVTKQKISELKDNDKSITDNKTMANMFNNFFSTIGTKIVNDLPTVNKDPLSYEYIPDYDQSLPMFYFDIPGPVHICDVVKSFENKSSPDLDDLSLKFVKKIISEISVPLAHIFRISLETGVFPEKLKTSRVVPIFKSGDPQNCDNYRPITLVSTLSKIL